MSPGAATGDGEARSNGHHGTIIECRAQRGAQEPYVIILKPNYRLEELTHGYIYRAIQRAAHAVD